MCHVGDFKYFTKSKFIKYVANLVFGALIEKNIELHETPSHHSCVPYVFILLYFYLFPQENVFVHSLVTTGNMYFLTHFLFSAPVTPLPVWSLALSLGCFVTLYTALGGLRGVVWTDVFQSGIMIAGILAVIIQVSEHIKKHIMSRE